MKVGNAFLTFITFSPVRSGYSVKWLKVYHYVYLILLPTGSDQKGVWWVWGIPVPILPACHFGAIVHLKCIKVNKVGYR